MKFIARLLLLVAAIGVSAFLRSGHRSQSVTQHADREIIPGYESKSDALYISAKQARGSLPIFMAKYDAADQATKDTAKIIAVIPDENSKLNILELKMTSYDSDSYTGKITEGGEENTLGYKDGDTVSVPFANVIDWQLRDGNKTLGGYVTCAMAKEGKVISRGQVDMLGIDCPGLARPDARNRQDVVNISDSDPDMLKAMADAQSHLDEFLNIADAKADGVKNFTVKVAMPVRNQPGKLEYIWVSDFSHTGDHFTGKLSDRPEADLGFQSGDTVAFERKQISDWMYVDHGTAKGGYTTCVILKHIPEDQRRAMLEKTHLSCG